MLDLTGGVDEMPDACGWPRNTATPIGGPGGTGALAKLEQVLPSRLRHRVNAVDAATVTVPGTGPRVDADVLTAVATAIRARERLRFDYNSHDGEATVRAVEPHRLVSWGRRWYLVAWDVDRTDWRTFRVDRISPRTPTGPRFTPRDLADDVSSYVQRGVGSAIWDYTSRVTVHAPADQVRRRLPPAVAVTELDEQTCLVDVGADSPHMLALYLGLLDVDFEATDSPELSEHLEKLAARYRRAARAHRSSGSRASRNDS